MSAPEHLHPIIAETVLIERDGAERRRDWCVVLSLYPVREHDEWIIRWGEVSGQGDSPIAAMADFDRAMYATAKRESAQEHSQEPKP